MTAPTADERRRRSSPTADELAYLPATELLRLLARGRVTSRELVDLALERAASADRTNAVVTVDETARQRADAADRDRRDGNDLGPLHGLPMTIKDTIDTAGIRTTSGLTETAGRVPTSDAESVRRLREAGAVIVGKSNVPAGGVDLQTYNPVFGTTTNPWDPSRTAGGSSGGAAAALATGLSPLDVGSDIGGSIRIPAHFCGVYGHKPTYGIVPNRGGPTAPVGFRAEPDISVCGPLARSAADLRLALGVLTGPNGARDRGWRLELPPPPRAMADYRVAVWSDDVDCPVDADTAAAVRLAAAHLSDAGARVEELTAPPVPLARAFDVYLRLFYAALAGSMSFPRALTRAAAVLPGGAAQKALRYSSASHRDWLEAHEAREELRVQWDRFFNDYDVVICPVAPTVAIPHDHSFGSAIVFRTISVEGQRRSYMDLFAWPGVVGAAHLPATVAPVAQTTERLPVGVQIVGAYLGDLTTIDLAERLAPLIGGYQRPPD